MSVMTIIVLICCVGSAQKLYGTVMSYDFHENILSGMNFTPACEVCSSLENLLRCSRCKRVYYCCKDHQTTHWKTHKKYCSTLERPSNRKDITQSINPSRVYFNENSSSLESNIFDSESTQSSSNSSSSKRSNSPITSEGSSEQEILNASIEVLSPNFTLSDTSLDFDNFDSTMPTLPDNSLSGVGGRYVVMDTNNVTKSNNYNDLEFSSVSPPFLHRKNEEEKGIIDEICKTVIQDMNLYGVCVIDNFLGPEKGKCVFEEVMGMHDKGVFKDGQLVRNKTNSDLKNIRGDLIAWTDGKENYCQSIGFLISRVDSIIMRAAQMSANRKLGNYTINGRTKAMVACYPGNGTHYVKHVDNPNRDGRCITAIYYLNKDWDIKHDGGLLRIFPQGWSDQVADIEPLFDRILFFWSDRRNPHEVQPSYSTRYAITLWYFDAIERENACRRYQNERTHQVYRCSSSSNPALKRPYCSLEEPPPSFEDTNNIIKKHRPEVVVGSSSTVAAALTNKSSSPHTWPIKRPTDVY